MAATSRHATSTSWDEIPVIDKVGEGYKPLKGLSPASLAKTHSIAYWSSGGKTILVSHEEGTKTFLQGHCGAVGLTELCPQREIEAVRGQRVVEVEFSVTGTVYILVEDGTLYSAGDPLDGQLGRPDNPVPADHFGVVPIPQPVKHVAARFRHVLAMAEDRVFAFGDNDAGQLGIPGGDGKFSNEPRQLYAGEGAEAPQQVACGLCHSVIRTKGGQVFTCGYYGYTGQGAGGGVCEMGEVRGLRGHPVQQVGSTTSCTYALSGGVLYSWGGNTYGQMGVGHKSEEKWIREPTVINCGGRQITSFRCELGLVVALTDSGDALYWGWRPRGSHIQSPQPVTGRLHPREVFAEGTESGGLVFLDTEENRHRLFRIDVRRLQDIVAALQCDLAGKR